LRNRGNLFAIRFRKKGSLSSPRSGRWLRDLRKGRAYSALFVVRRLTWPSQARLVLGAGLQPSFFGNGWQKGSLSSPRSGRWLRDLRKGRAYSALFVVRLPTWPSQARLVLGAGLQPSFFGNGWQKGSLSSPLRGRWSRNFKKGPRLQRSFCGSASYLALTGQARFRGGLAALFFSETDGKKISSPAREAGDGRGILRKGCAYSALFADGEL